MNKDNETVINRAVEAGANAVSNLLMAFIESIELSQFYGINDSKVTPSVYKRILVAAVEKFVKKFDEKYK